MRRGSSSWAARSRALRPERLGRGVGQGRQRRGGGGGRSRSSSSSSSSSRGGGRSVAVELPHLEPAFGEGGLDALVPAALLLRRGDEAAALGPEAVPRAEQRAHVGLARRRRRPGVVEHGPAEIVRAVHGRPVLVARHAVVQRRERPEPRHSRRGLGRLGRCRRCRRRRRRPPPPPPPRPRRFPCCPRPRPVSSAASSGSGPWSELAAVYGLDLVEKEEEGLIVRNRRQSVSQSVSQAGSQSVSQSGVYEVFSS